MLAERQIYSVIENEYFGVKREWYRIHDTDKSGGAIQIRPEQAEMWNRNGWGIFHAINSFSGPRRKEYLSQINAWAIDIDGGNKKDHLKKIWNAPILPSLVVETKSGFHLYWNAKDAIVSSYKSIIEDRLIPFFGADERAKDLSRLLRVPGFFHAKDPNDPFMIKVRHWNNVSYSEADILFAFPKVKKDNKEQQKKVKDLNRVLVDQIDGNLSDRIYKLDCQQALSKLSGSAHVNGENYSFKKVSKGNLNIFVNGKSTSCWIDQNKRIGSVNGGGPTIWQWLKWFGYTNSEIFKIIKKEFPELWNEK